jgi:carboxypeptidase C (cathepsin A)
VEPNLSLKRNPYSWNSFANLLYIDQPVGTGTSSSSNAATLHADEARVGV